MPFCLLIFVFARVHWRNQEADPPWRHVQER